jgi:hypothetical protein
MFDWQSIAVVLIVAGALLYVARRGLARLRSFAGGRTGNVSECATGCGKCGDDATAGPRAVAPQVVQISRARTTSEKAR